MIEESDDLTLMDITEELTDDTRAVVLGSTTFQTQPHVGGGHPTWYQKLVDAGEMYAYLKDLARSGDPVPKVPPEYRTPEVTQLMHSVFGIVATRLAWRPPDKERDERRKHTRSTNLRRRYRGRKQQLLDAYK